MTYLEYVLCHIQYTYVYYWTFRIRYIGHSAYVQCRIQYPYCLLRHVQHTYYESMTYSAYVLLNIQHLLHLLELVLHVMQLLVRDHGLVLGRLKALINSLGVETW